MVERSRRSLSRVSVWTLLGAVGAAGALILVFGGLTSGLRPGSGDIAADYRAVPVRRDLLRETVVASGTMEPLVRVPVISEISGIIAAVHVEEGARVSRGEILFELDRERPEARVAQR